MGRELGQVHRRQLTVEMRVAPDRRLRLLRLPPLVLLDAPLPRLSPLHILTHLLRIGFETQCLRKFALLLQPLELLRRHLGLLMVGNEISSVVRCRLVLTSAQGR